MTTGGAGFSRPAHLLVVTLITALSACALDEQGTPGLTGPSELGLSISVTATPDIVRQNGSETALVVIQARDQAAQPVPGVDIQVETIVNGVVRDFGLLSSRRVQTNSSGTASLTYLPPALPAVAEDFGLVIVLRLTPVGSDFANSTPRFVQIRLVPPGQILPPNGTPIASFNFSPSAPREQEDIYFDASASRDDGKIVLYHWAFGDGGMHTSTSPTVRSAYEVQGAYTVTLTVTDDRGLTASATQAVVVSKTDNPTAEFTVSPTNPLVDQAVSFNASASTVPAGRSIVSYEWDFGDGSPSQTGERVEHSYATANEFTVVLKVTDNLGRVGVKSKTVKVGSPAPNAQFTFSPTSPVATQQVQFNASQSTAPAGRTIASYRWNFGDGTPVVSGSNAEQSHAFSLAGEYTVTLTVEDSEGAIAVVSRTVTVG